MDSSAVSSDDLITRTEQIPEICKGYALATVAGEILELRLNLVVHKVNEASQMLERRGRVGVGVLTVLVVLTACAFLRNLMILLIRYDDALGFSNIAASLLCALNNIVCVVQNGCCRVFGEPLPPLPDLIRCKRCLNYLDAKSCSTLSFTIRSPKFGIANDVHDVTRGWISEIGLSDKQTNGD